MKVISISKLVSYLMAKGLLCKGCAYWYGGEDFGYGPCQVKLQRGDRAHLTHGQHPCDEPEVRDAR